MNIATIIKPNVIIEREYIPSGISQAMNGAPIVSNDVTWSSATSTWSDALVMWGVQNYSNNAEPPKMSQVTIVKP